MRRFCQDALSVMGKQHKMQYGSGNVSTPRKRGRSRVQNRRHADTGKLQEV